MYLHTYICILYNYAYSMHTRGVCTVPICIPLQVHALFLKSFIYLRICFPVSLLYYIYTKVYIYICIQ